MSPIASHGPVVTVTVTTMTGCFSGFIGSFKPKNKAQTNNGLNPARHCVIPCDFSPDSKFCTLEEWQSSALESPPTYSALKDVFMPEAAKTIEASITALSDELRTLSIKIHEHPELGYEEVYAHKVLTEFMRSHDFAVTPHYAGLNTAWKATWSHKSGGRVLGFNSEMDALPGVGHACGHNLIAIGGVAAALGVKAALEKHDIPGTVVLLGTPAEEGGMGKVKLIDYGAYKGMDACLMIHPSPGPKLSAGTGSALALVGVDVEYFGHTAHAAASPWEGQNALDAAFLAYSSISVLRQQIKPTHRVHGTVSGRDWAANIIPDYAKMRWLIRAPTYAEVEALQTRVQACFDAAALATGCKIKVLYDQPMYDLRQNIELAEEFADVLARHGQFTDKSVAGAVGGSTDFGNVTYEVPALHPSFAIPTTEGGGNHTRGFTASAATMEAHEATLAAAKGISIAGFRVLADKGFSDKVKKSFDEVKTTVQQ